MKQDEAELLQIEGEVLPESFYSQLSEVTAEDVEQETVKLRSLLPPLFQNLPEAQPNP